MTVKPDLQGPEGPVNAKSTWGMVPHWVLSVSGQLRTIELRVLVAIAVRCNAQWTCWAKHSTLAEDIGGANERSIRKAVAGLVAHGFVTTTCDGRVTTYQLHRPTLGREYARTPLGRTDRPTMDQDDRTTGIRTDRPSERPVSLTDPRTDPPEQTQEQTPPVPQPKPQTLALEGGDQDGVQALFVHWQQAMGRPRSKLDDKRRRVLTKALREYGMAECKQAITGLSLSDFHMGRDEKTGGKAYNDVENVFRSAAHVERFMEATASKESDQPVVSYTTLHADWTTAYLAHIEQINAAELTPATGHVARQWPRLAPGWFKQVQGVAVPVFEERAMLNVQAVNTGAAKLAAEWLVKHYPDNDMAKEIGLSNMQDCKRALLREYNLTIKELADAAH